jgi:hypothetical protein
MSAAAAAILQSTHTGGCVPMAAWHRIGQQSCTLTAHVPAACHQAITLSEVCHTVLAGSAQRLHSLTSGSYFVPYLVTAASVAYVAVCCKPAVVVDCAAEWIGGHFPAELKCT